MPVSTVIGDSIQVRNAKIGTWDGDGTYSNILTLYGVTTIEADVNIITAIREGDGKKLAAYAAINGGTLRVTAATNQLAVLAALLGQTYAITGSTPNQVGKLQIFNKSIGYIGFICGVDDDAGLENAFHFFAPKGKITSDTVAVLRASGGESPEFGTFDIELELFADNEFNVGEQNEIQQLALSAPSAGTFTLTFGSETTATIAYNAAASAIEDALELLANIGTGNVAVAAGSDFNITFQGTLANAKVPLLTGDDAALTDGEITVTRTTTGGEGDDLIMTLYEDEQGTTPLLPPAL
jgi:hypothetical protein